MRIRQFFCCALALIVSSGCISSFGPDIPELSKDSAVRLAECLQEAINNTPTQPTVVATCHVVASGSYLVVLHPQGALTDEELTAGGVPGSLIPEVRALRNFDDPAIYVIETNQYATGIGEFRKPKSGRTTSQNSFVRIDRLQTLARLSHVIVVTMTGPAGARVIEKIE